MIATNSVLAAIRRQSRQASEEQAIGREREG